MYSLGLRMRRERAITWLISGELYLFELSLLSKRIIDTVHMNYFILVNLYSEAKVLKKGYKMHMPQVKGRGERLSD